MSCRVVIADSTPLLRLAARMALTDAGLVVAAEVGTAREAVEAAIDGADAVLLDEDLDPRMDAVRAICDAVPAPAVIVLTTSGTDSAARAAVQAGACGFISKETPSERLPAIVLGVLAGEAAIPRQLVRRLLCVPSRGGALDPSSLSGREREVLHLLAQGMRDRSVGEHLGVSEVTVRRHAATATQKLGVTGRREAIDLIATAAP